MTRVRMSRPGGRLLFLALMGLCLSVSAAFAAETRIINGKPAQAGQWPWMAAIADRNVANEYDASFCGGSLIGPDWIVTAAHCVADGLPVDALIGKTDLKASGGERIRVAQTFVHPAYNDVISDNDVALLRLERAATLNGGQYAALIPMGDPAGLAAPGKSATVLGWGNTVVSGASSYPKDLLEASVTIIDQALLTKQYGAAETTDNMLGAAAPGTDTCQGDSGGPLLVKDAAGTGWILAGVTSTGWGCADPDHAGVYARVSRYVDWIKATLVDRDGDGAPDSVDAAPDDATQAAVGSGAQAVAVRTLGGEILSGVAAVDPADPLVSQANKPADHDFPYRLIHFKVKAAAPGGQAKVQLAFPATLPSGSRIYKTTATGFVDVTAKAAISGSAVTLTLTDGDAVDDADGAKDGVITDPVGVATPQATPGAPGAATAASGGGGGGGGGCQLGGEAAPGAEWALLALGALAVRFRSRRSQ